METFEAACQGLGLALACGLVFGAPGAGGPARRALAPAAALAGAVLFALSLGATDHPGWPGTIPGALAGLFAFVVASRVSSGARARAGDSGGSVAPLVALSGLALAGVSLLGPIACLSLAALVALVWFQVSRTRKAGAKHAGLRTLR